MRNGELEKALEILSCEEFLPLKILVLLLAWPFCRSCESAQILLDSLASGEVSKVFFA